MVDDKTALSGEAVLSEGIDDWRVVLNKLVARFDTGDFNAGTALVAGIAEAADEANHHPDVDLRYPHVTVSLVSHDVGAITPRDVRLARRISELAAEAGHRASQAPDVLEFAIDTASTERVLPFWSALLGYTEGEAGQVDADEDEVLDPAGRNPAIWFQSSDSDAPDRQRWHLDVSVPREVAETRIEAAVAAGGTLVSDERAPAFWVLADPDGNQACICTWEGRSAPSEGDS